MGWMTPTLKNFFRPDSAVYMTHDQSSWMVSVVEMGNLFSILPAGLLFNSCGRKPFILSTGPVYLLGWVIIYYSTNIVALCTARFIQGLAMGIVFTVVPVYLGEISSPDIRGAVTSSFQIGLNLGFLIEYCLGPFVSYSTLILITSGFPLISFLYSFYIPESPYYLVIVGRYRDASESLAWLRGTDNTDHVEEEMREIMSSVQREMENQASWSDILQSPTERRALIIVQIIGVVKIMSGCFAILTYSTQMFSEYDNNLLPPDMLTIAMGSCMFASSFCSSSLTDRLGRRPLLMISTIGCSFPLFFVGLFFYLKQEMFDLSLFGWVPSVSVMLYCILFAFGLDPVTLTYRSEMFSANTRGMAACISTVNLTIGSFLTLKYYQVLEDSYGLYVVYWIFSSVCVFGSLYIYFFAIETRGKTFAEIQKQLSDLVKKQKQPENIANSSVKETTRL